MTSGALIDGAAIVEPFVLTLVGTALVAFIADWLLAGDRSAPARSLDTTIPRRTEYRLLALILVVALGLRLVGWDSAITPVFWFSEVSTLFVDQWLRADTLWTTWVRQLSTTDVLGPHDAALVLPVLAALQALIGPRFGLPVLCGAFFGGLAVLLAWALGRGVRSQAFGLVFAALVAVSPLALTWSRLSGFCVAAVTHVLLTLLVGWEAGRRGSVLLAILTGLVAWTSIYHYYAARVAIPLAPLVLLAGSQRAGRIPRGIVLAALAASTFVAMAYLVHGGATPQRLWPSYGGYAGNKGERTLVEFVERNVASFWVELRHALERYFLERRVGWDSDVWRPGMAQGGLALLPVSVLGVVGLVAVARRVRRQWLWYLVAAAGLALPAISVMTARRVLVFDLAWCAFAAHGLLAVVDTLGARFSHATRARLAGLGVAVVGVGSAATIFLLSAALPRGTAQQIPFADAGFGDGVACRRCIDAAQGWSREMADGAFVVLFDNDVMRENRTSPGGLVAYGKIATLVAGTPGRFVEAYELLAGIDIEPPAPGPMFDRNATTFLAHLTEAIDRAAPTRIVWHFERPTAWERWLAGRLAAAGGSEERFPTPLAPSEGIRIVTSWARRADALAVLGEMAAGLAPEADSSCITLAERRAFTLASTVLGLAPDGPGTADVPEWLATSFLAHRYRTDTFEAAMPVGAWVRRGVGNAARIGLFTEHGIKIAYDLPSRRRTDIPPSAAMHHGLNCAAFAGGHWWVLEPWSGEVTSTHPAAAQVPRGEWIGIAVAPSGALVLASGDQQIVVFDPARRRELARFPARVAPSVRQMLDECTPIAVGSNWIATADLRTSVLSVYDQDGQDLGTRRLDRLVRLPFPLTGLAGAGHYLGVAIGTMVRIFELRTCPDPRRPLGSE